MAGVLVHRVLAMPYAKPKRLREHKGEIWIWGWGKAPRPVQPMVAAASVAAQELEGALRRGMVGEGWDLAEALIDAGGPWWSGPLGDFQGLAALDQQAVLDTLQEAAEEAAEELQHWLLARKRRSAATWMWSEVPLPAGLGPARPEISRPDLVLGTRGGRVILIDIKTAWGHSPSWSAGGHARTTLRGFRRWKRLIRQMDEHDVRTQFTYWVLQVTSLGYPGQVKAQRVALDAAWRARRGL